MPPLIKLQKRFIVPPYAVFFVFAVFFYAPAEISAQEQPVSYNQTKFEYCKDGIEKDLNPNIAVDCLKYPWFKETCEKNNIALLRKAVTLKDLSQCLDNHQKPGSLYHAFKTRLQPSSAADEFGFWTDENKFIGWIGKYKGSGKTLLAKQAMRFWDTLDEDARNWLGKRNLTAGGWNSLSLERKSYHLELYARETADAFIKTPGEKLSIYGKSAMEQNRKIWDQLYWDLPSDAEYKLRTHFSRIRALSKAHESTSAVLERVNPARLREFQAEIASIKNLPPEEQIKRLDKFFDNTPELKTSRIAGLLREEKLPAENKTSPAGDSPLKIDKKIVAPLLETALKNEIRGTMVGDELLKICASHWKNSFNMTIDNTGNAGAQFDPESGKIILSERKIQKWLAKNKYTANDLQTKPEPIKDLARLLALDLVHEAKHKEHNLWLKKERLPDVYTPHDEIETFFTEQLFAMEKSIKNPDYAKWFVKEYADTRILPEAHVFRTNPAALERKIKTNWKLYTNLHSFESASANFFIEDEKRITNELNRRAKEPKNTEEEKNKLREECPPEQEIRAECLSTHAIASIKTGDLEEIKNYLSQSRKKYEKRMSEELARLEKMRLTLLEEEKKKTGGKPAIPPPQ